MRRVCLQRTVRWDLLESILRCAGFPASRGSSAIGRSVCVSRQLPSEGEFVFRGLGTGRWQCHCHLHWSWSTVGAGQTHTDGWFTIIFVFTSDLHAGFISCQDLRHSNTTLKFFFLKHRPSEHLSVVTLQFLFEHQTRLDAGRYLYDLLFTGCHVLGWV